MPEWWNGRHDRLKICCEQSCKSSSLFSGIESFSNREAFFCLNFYVDDLNSLGKFEPELMHGLCQ